jgi:hypothetical protein
MQRSLRITFKRTFFLLITPVSHQHLLASAFRERIRERHISTRQSSSNHTSAVKKAAKSKQRPPPTSSSSLNPLPDPPLPLKGTPSIISTRDIGEYIEPLYSRGWGLTPILPNGNGIPVLRKRFEFTSVDALQDFLADIREYEEKKQVRSFSWTTLQRSTSSWRLIAFSASREDERI